MTIVPVYPFLLAVHLRMQVEGNFYTQILRIRLLKLTGLVITILLIFQGI